LLAEVQSIMFWPFKSRSPAQPCLAIGQYSIGANVDAKAGFRPFSSEELVLLNPEMTFEGEQILHAPDAIFMDLRWDTVLGVVHGEIYKISIQWTGPRHEVGAIERQIKVQCTKLYGKGENMAVWDASDGNIIVDGSNLGSEAILTVTVTSSRVRRFKRVR
jgi:hypothetical protein